MRLIKYIINNYYKMLIKIINSNKKLINNNKFISIWNSIEQKRKHFYYKIVNIYKENYQIWIWITKNLSFIIISYINIYIVNIFIV